jgi:hypothetical protein
MKKLAREDLWSLEQYAEQRPGFRNEVMAHKRDRQLALNENARLYFEDQLTVKYQVQEMLRIERIFNRPEIEDELAAYNPLIPDGSNWKATFMIEYSDVDERRTALAKLVGVEDKLWMQVDGHDKVWAIADEDMDRDNADKTSSVHFVRFELDADMVKAAKSGAAISAGVEHPALRIALDPIPDNVRNALSRDLD